MRPAYKPKNPIKTEDLDYLMDGLEPIDQRIVDHFADGLRDEVKSHNVPFGPMMGREAVLAVLRFMLDNPEIK